MKTVTVYHSRAPGFTSGCLVGSILFICLVFYVVCFVLFVFVLSLSYPMLPVSVLFVFVLSLSYPMLPVSVLFIFVLSLSCPMLPVSVLFVFVLSLSYPMLPVSLNCPFFIIPSVFSKCRAILTL